MTEEEFIPFFEQQLPRYKRPRRVIFDEVPRSPTGKIEKPKLRAKYTARNPELMEDKGETEVPMAPKAT